LIRIKVRILAKIPIILVKTLTRSLITAKIKIITIKEIQITGRMDLRKTLKGISRKIGLQASQKTKMKMIGRTNINPSRRRKW